VVILEKLEQSKANNETRATPRPQPAYETPEERELRKANEQIIRDRAAAQAAQVTAPGDKQVSSFWNNKRT
jgi:hypothetical protein